MLVGSVVVADQVQLAPRIAAGERVDEGDDLDVPMASETARMDFATGDHQGSKQTGGAMARVSIDEQILHLFQRRH